ncbi:Acyl carrier protein [Pseudoalteromonas holothuriae]|uniref:Acyl carrier protein n=1 Tax=Pseudoalteromonas holothuriae TaxID=2963714 RepID=A0ABM9GNB9_9GAMM|nr:SDR family NAD(P)-dependent oxidoreductase [Pseudoalteromonas sp. CIP111951]CAH9068080.1 Acyl carrier protein [Pseudoalteromonas sp. CIP111951]
MDKNNKIKRFILRQLKEQQLSLTEAKKLLSRAQLEPIRQPHPFLQLLWDEAQNTIHYQGYFSGHEPYVADHQVQGQHILPGVLFLEIIQSAILDAFQINDELPVQLLDFIWLAPVVFQQGGLKVSLTLDLSDEKRLRFELSSELQSQRVIHCQGDARICAGVEPEIIDLSQKRTQCKKVLSGEQCYQQFSQRGIFYGPSQQAIVELARGDEGVIARLQDPDQKGFYPGRLRLTPSLMDAALQACVGFYGEQDNIPKVPFTFSFCQQYFPFESQMQVWVQSTGKDRFDLAVCDISGRLALKLKGLMIRAIKQSTTPHIYVPQWQISPSDEIAPPLSTTYALLLGLNEHKVHLTQLGHQVQHIELQQTTTWQQRAQQFHHCFESIKAKINDMAIACSDTTPLLLQVLLTHNCARSIHSGISGLLASAKKEIPGFFGQVIVIEEKTSSNLIDQYLAENQHHKETGYVQYQGEQRHILHWQDGIAHQANNTEQLLKARGTYLVVGGLGGIGRHISRYLVSLNNNINLILLGTRPFNDEMLPFFTELSLKGTRVHYESLDIGSAPELAAAIEKVRANFGEIKGVIHCAGVIQDSLLSNKSSQEVSEVFAPKVNGILNLDAQTASEPLDFFVAFTSVSGVAGNMGQSDYSAANGFVDGFMHERNDLVSRKKRYGQSLSIAWPLWRDGGMQATAQMLSVLKKQGVEPLETETALQVFHNAMLLEASQVLVVPHVDMKEGEQVHSSSPELPQATSAALHGISVDLNKGHFIRNYLKTLIAKVTKLSSARLEDDVLFEKYGLDSVKIVELTALLENTFGTQSKTLFFEYQTVDEMANYLLKRYEEQVSKLVLASAESDAILTESITDQIDTQPILSVSSDNDDIATSLSNYLRKLLADVTKLPLQRIENDVLLEKYGLDSVKVMEVTHALETNFGALPRTLFFEYQTVNDLVNYFVNTYDEQVTQQFILENSQHPTQSRSFSTSSTLNVSSETEHTELPVSEHITALKKALREILSSVTKLSTDRIKDDVLFEKFGIDSVKVMEITSQLEKTFGALPKTLFFEYQTLSELAEYFALNHQQNSRTWVTNIESTRASVAASKMASDSVEFDHKKDSLLIEKSKEDFTSSLSVAKLVTEPKNCIESQDSVAVVGLAGRYPMADSLADFWQNLVQGRDCISQIPEERWDNSLFFDSKKASIGKIHSNHGGFMSGVYEFDPLFFNISPREAKFLEPQERLFLQTAYHAVEDAGYTRQTISNNTGVYVGTMYLEYQMFGELAEVGSVALPGSPASIANRVSHFFNLDGPSMAIDTMCSSSLSALHLACNAIKNKEIEMAIIGGVNTLLHPNKYLLLSQGQFISQQGYCKSFGKGGEGYIPGEGVGAVVLVPLSMAQAEGRHVYGIIKGTALNHGGRANGFTVPNPNAQANVIRNALANAGVEPQTISYIEAHGTGTSLGDPIEISGLQKAFSSAEHSHCAIGAVKSNIGHLESAAGIASLTKVLLQLRHKQLVPSLHSSQLNPDIDFASSPFSVQQHLEPWHNDEALPQRRSGISSFGAGGANAHVVVEEYINEVLPPIKEKVSKAFPVVILISAKDEAALKRQVRVWLDEISSKEDMYCDGQLRSIALSSQLDKEALEFRLAVVVESIVQLKTILEHYLNTHNNNGLSSAGLFYGHSLLNSNAQAQSFDLWPQSVVNGVIERELALASAKAWIEGVHIPWQTLYLNTIFTRFKLPTYCFAKESYFIAHTTKYQAKEHTQVTKLNSLHPLLQQNVSTLGKQCFRTLFTGNELELRDHLIQGRRILPGMAYLEMAYQAVCQSLPISEHTITLRNIVWLAPLQVNSHDVCTHTHISTKQNGVVQFVISTLDDQQNEQVHCKGEVILHVSATVPQQKSFEDVSAPTNFLVENLADFYEQLKVQGVEYGSSFQCLNSIAVGECGAVAKLQVPKEVVASHHLYTLHPFILDAATQACAFLLHHKSTAPTAMNLAFSLQDLTVYGACTERMIATIVPVGESGGSQKVNIELFDDKGCLQVSLAGLSFRALNKAASDINTTKEIVTSAPVWIPISTLDSHQQSGRSLRLSWSIEHGLLCHINGTSPVHVTPHSEVDWLANTLAEHVVVENIILDITKSTDSSETYSYNEYAQNPLTTSLLKLVQALLRCDLDRNSVNWIVLTVQAQAVLENEIAVPQIAGLYGLLGTAVKENPNWCVKFIDLDDGTQFDDEIPTVKSRPESYLSRRANQWFERRHINVMPDPISSSRFIRNGVYLLVGGAGTVGYDLSLYLAREYNARTIWLGRRALNESIQQKQDSIANFGPKPFYLSVDAADPVALQQAHEAITQQCGAVNGIVHCAMQLHSRSIQSLSREDFENTLKAKQDTSVHIVNIFKHAQLDFVLFISSISAFIRAHGQAGYATGCNFIDQFANYVAQQWQVPTKVMHLGYWYNELFYKSEQSLGLRNWLAREGMQAVQPEQAIQAIEYLLSSHLYQMAYYGLNDEQAHFGLPIQISHTLHSAQQQFVTSPSWYAQLPSLKMEKMARADELPILLADIEAVLIQILASHINELTEFEALSNGLSKWWKASNNILQQSTKTENVVMSIDESVVLWQSKTAQWRDHPVLAEQVDLLDTAVHHLAGILKGQISAQQVLFPKSDIAMLERVYQDSPSARFYNQLLSTAVVKAIEFKLSESVSEGKQAGFRILEIGAGTGGTTSAVLHELAKHGFNVELYDFTDISKVFLDHAKRKYVANYPYVKTRILDIERDPSVQGIETGSYDIVIASNVLHATKDIRNTLFNSQALLKSGGILLLNEINDASILSHMTFGLTEGWWRFDDVDMRLEGSPALSFSHWQNVLSQTHFRDIKLLGVQQDSMGQQVICAHSNGLYLTSNEDIKHSPSIAYDAVVDGDPVEVSREQKDGRALLAVVVEQVTQALDIEPERFDMHRPFSEFGLDSILGVSVTENINQALDIALNPTDLFDYATASQLTEFIERQFAPSVGLIQQHIKGTDGVQPDITFATEHSILPDALNEIAIIGMSGCFPGAEDVESLWRNIQTKANCLNSLSSFAQRMTGNETFEQSDITAGFLESIQEFDPLFFNITPREAAAMSPNQRLLMQQSWKALEDAGYDPTQLKQHKLGIFVGAEPAGFASESFTGSSDAIVASRMAYFLDTNGPALVVNTGCSSSAVAIHLGAESLRSKDSDMVLAAGAFAQLSSSGLSMLAQIGMLSPSGKCRTFDHHADGTVLSEAVAVVVLKRLMDAERDGDIIHAVLAASGINQDGTSNGITAPNGRAQQSLITDTYKKFAINPEHISYVEAHGTGTPLGDPVEIKALKRAFSEFTGKSAFCALGSIKPDIGHTSSASGVTGLIKVLLALKHQSLPSLNHFSKLNPAIELAGSAFYISEHHQHWQANDGQRMAAINSFGHSGTNVHLVVKDYTKKQNRGVSLPDNTMNNKVIIPISAKKVPQLKLYAERLLSHVNELRHTSVQHVDTALLSIAYTLQTGRAQFAHRAAFIVRSLDDLAQQLELYINVGHGETASANNASLTKEQIFADLQHYYETHPVDVVNQWLAGNAFNWQSIYGPIKPAKMQLPTYVFEKRNMDLDIRTEQQNMLKNSVVEEVKPTQTVANKYTNKATEFYSLGAEPSSTEFREEYLTFAPFFERRKGFSMTSFFLGLPMEQAERDMVLVKQRELRQVLFFKENFSQLNHVLDIGCGHGTDVIQLAALYPNLKVSGYTITGSQAQLGNERINRQGLSEQANIYHRDSSSDPFPNKYDLVFGIEVTFHIRNKQGVFDNIANALHEGGRLVLMDYISHLRGEIRDPNVEVTIPTLQTWADVLAEAGLVVVENIDVSHEIANFLYDPQLEDNIADLQEVAQSTLRNYANQSISLEQGWISYCLIKIEKNTHMSFAQRQESNIRALKQSMSYADAVAQMHTLGEPPYPKSQPVFAKQSKRSYVGELALYQPQLETLSVQASRSLTQPVLVLLAPELAQYASELSATSHLVEEYLILDHFDFESAHLAKTAIEKTLRILQKRIKQHGRGLNIKLILTRRHELAVHACYAAMLKTISIESTNIDCQTIYVGNANSHLDLLNALESGQNHLDCKELHYAPEQPLATRILKQSTLIDNLYFSLEKGRQQSWADAGVYLITGGLGGIGQIFAKEILTTTQRAVVILVGRSPLDTQRLAKLKPYAHYGDRIQYESCDVADANQVERLIQSIESKFGVLSGVIHSAGLTNDGAFIGKQWSQVDEVLRAKIDGTINLDLSTRHSQLAFFAVFTSISGYFGNAGQADYALANAFADNYITHRRTQTNVGHSIAIAWPHWLSGNLHLEASVASVAQQLGLSSLHSQEGLAAFYHALANEGGCYVVFKADLKKLTSGYLRHYFDAQQIEPDSAPTDIDHATHENVIQAVVDVFQQVLYLNQEDLSADSQFIEMGIDSINAVQVTEGINQKFSLSLPTSIMFEFDCIAKVAAYVAEHTTQSIAFSTPDIDEDLAHVLTQPSNILNTAEKTLADIITYLESLFAEVFGLSHGEFDRNSSFQSFGLTSINAIELIEAINQRCDSHLPTSIIFECDCILSLANYMQSQGIAPQKSQTQSQQSASATAQTPEQVEHMGPTFASLATGEATSGVAIIGMACCAGGVKGLDELWQTVQTQTVKTDVVKDVQWLEFFQQYCPDLGPLNYGAMQDLEQFDAAFFNISIREAEAMDAAQRIMLEQCYLAIEDSGYAAEQLRGKRVGTFIGSMGSTPSAADMSHHSMLGTETSVLAGRVAHFFDFSGPALVVNTACSSSLVAVDMAYNKLIQGQIDLALAGGITIYTHPSAFVSMQRANMLSKSGACRPFDNAADGILVGDGAGIVILKRLQDALKDKDDIYSVIRASGTNHDGRASAITTPSFLAQSALIQEVYRSAHIKADNIQYIEAHGTGTKLGDPVEIHALTDAYMQFTQRKQFCAVGSLKANLGHTSAASGVLSLIKVSLALQHKLIPASANFNVENQHIDFKSSPVYVNDRVQKWPLNDEQSRLAAISSFGFSGTNVHLVVEQAKDIGVDLTQANGPIVLSAQTMTELRLQALQLKLFLQKNQNKFETPSLFARVCYTLQTGREHLPARLALIASDVKVLLAKLERFINVGSDDAIGIICDVCDDTCAALSERGIDYENAQAIANAWVRGECINWLRLYSSAIPGRVHLPGYTFANDKRLAVTKLVASNSNKSSQVTKHLDHPMLQRNESKFGCQVFCSDYSGSEHFIADHQVGGHKILPATAHLEMAFAAFKQSLPISEDALVISITNVTWRIPVVIDEPLKVNITITPVANKNSYEFQIGQHNLNGEKDVSACVKGLLTTDVLSRPFIDLEQLLSQQTLQLHQGQTLYDIFEQGNIHYGQSHRCISEYYTLPHSSDSVLAKLTLAEEVSEQLKVYSIHPGILDAAIQASVALVLPTIGNMRSEEMKLALPYSAERITVYEKCQKQMWAYIRYNKNNGTRMGLQQLDIDLCNSFGKVCIAIKGLTSKIPTNKQSEYKQPDKKEHQWYKGDMEVDA